MQVKYLRFWMAYCQVAWVTLLRNTNWQTFLQSQKLLSECSNMHFHFCFYLFILASNEEERYDWQRYLEMIGEGFLFPI